MLGTHVGGRADELLEGGIDGLVGQAALRGLGNAEINHLGHGHAVVQGNEDVRRLNVAVDYALLMGVLNRTANLDEEIQPFARGKLVAVVGDLNPAHQFHDEVRSPRLRRARVEYFGNVWMVHHRECLPLGVKAGDDLFGVHAELDDLERNAAAHWFFLFGDIYNTATTLADLLEKFVAANPVARFFGRWKRRYDPSRRRRNGRFFHETASAFEGAKQQLHATP